MTDLHEVCREAYLADAQDFAEECRQYLEAAEADIANGTYLPHGANPDVLEIYRGFEGLILGLRCLMERHQPEALRFARVHSALRLLDSILRGTDHPIRRYIKGQRRGGGRESGGEHVGKGRPLARRRTSPIPHMHGAFRALVDKYGLSGCEASRRVEEAFAEFGFTRKASTIRTEDDRIGDDVQREIEFIKGKLAEASESPEDLVARAAFHAALNRAVPFGMMPGPGVSISGLHERKPPKPVG